MRLGTKPVRDELLGYYERELTFLRQLGGEFAAQYPKVASRLQLEPNRCEDPHVERLIEAVALLAARIHLRLDDDFPEITQALLNVVYPHYTRPAEWQGRAVPEVLLSGHHAAVAAWRRAEALRLTGERRPDLLDGRPEISSKASS